MGPPDFSVTPDWSIGRPRAQTVNYWLCADAPAGIRERAKRVHDTMRDTGAVTPDESALASLAAELSDLDLQGKVCTAVYNAEDHAWYPLTRCSKHSDPNSGPYYLIVDLAGGSGARPAALPFGSRHFAEEALSTIGSSVGDTVTFTNERGSLLRVRRDLIVDARVSTQAPSDPAR